LRTKTHLHPRFLNFYLNLEKSQNNLRRLATRGVSQSNINAQSLKSIRVPIPTIEEQERITSIIENQDRAINLEKSKKTILEKLKSGLMQILLRARKQCA